MRDWEVEVGDGFEDAGDVFVFGASIHDDGTANGAGDVVKHLEPGEGVGEGFFADGLSAGPRTDGHGFAADLDLVQVAVKDDEGGLVVCAGENDVMTAADDDRRGSGWMLGEDVGDIIGRFREIGNAAPRRDVVRIELGKIAVMNGFHTGKS